MGQSPQYREAETVKRLFDVAVDDVMEFGDEVNARNYTTIELRNYHVRVMDPQIGRIVWDPSDPRREFIESEIATVRLGQKPEVNLKGDALDEKLDLDDGTFYEDIIRERISNDWDEWVELLENDPETRKACSLFGSGPNPPCTSRVQWMLRDGKLNCYTYNRSQQMKFAFPMDMGLFETYQVMLADELDVPVGHHDHIMSSAHVYV